MLNLTYKLHERKKLLIFNLYSYARIIVPLFVTALIILWSLCAPASPKYFHQFFNYDLKRILQIYLFIFMTISFFIFPKLALHAIRLIENTDLSIKLSLVFFFWIGLVSSLFSNFPVIGLIGLSSYVFIFIYALFWNAVGEACGDRIFMISSILFVAWLSFYLCFVAPFYWSYLTKKTALNLYPYFSNIRFFSQFISWILPYFPVLSAYIIAKKLSPILSILVSVLCGFFWMLVICNGSRGLALSFSVSCLLSIFIFKNKSHTWFYHQILYFILGLVFSWFFIAFIPSIFHLHILSDHFMHYASTNVQARLIMYKQALEQALQHPLMGIGPMNYATHHNALRPEPHNFMILIATEWGMPAFVALCYIICRLGYQFIIKIKAMTYNASTYKSVVITACFTSLLTGSLYSMFSCVMTTPLSQIMFAIILGNCICLYNSHNNQPPPGKKSLNTSISKLHILIVLFFLGLACITYALWVMPTIRHLTYNELIWLNHQPRNTMFTPRFWIQGWVGRF